MRLGPIRFSSRIKSKMKLFISFCFSIFLIVALVITIAVTAASIQKEDKEKHAKAEEQPTRLATCGYDGCTRSDPGKINIHLVAHSHDDVGWLKTVDQYFLGLQEYIQKACVRDIIDSVVDALVKEPSRRFIYVETAYLWRWWERQNEEKRQITKNLINEGRLEIIGGGWSMNDEATTFYQTVIDQFTWGFRRLNDTFGECARPKIGWQIDPFGHSREQASMFAKFGFDGLFFARLDYQDKAKRLRDKTMEFIWEGSPSLGSSANLFTSVLYNHYSAPSGFCFDVSCQNVPLYDDPRTDANYNIERKVQQFLKFVNEQASVYRTNNIIITMGDDFHYRHAEMYLENVDKLVKGINNLNGTKYKAFYSTPSCYVKAVNEQNLTWTTKSDDLFPYISHPHASWTGYFTSRPTLKFFERLGNNFLQVVKQLTVLTNTSDSQQLELFREIMGVMQHHDAVTGTEKQHVAEDYAFVLHHNMKNGERLASNALRKWLTKNEPEHYDEPMFYTCLQLNISSCEHTTGNSKFVVTVYNPTSQRLNTFVRLPVMNSQLYSVRDSSGNELVTQLVPIPKRVQEIPGRFSIATEELVFQAANIAPLGYQSFYVNITSNELRASSVVLLADEPDTVEPFIQKDDEVGRSNKDKIYVNEEGRISVKSRVEGVEYEQSFEYYESKYGPNGNYNRTSGAYVFRPKHNYTKKLTATGAHQVFKGPLVQEIHQEINDWVSQVVRVYNQEDYVEFNWLVGPIPVEYGDTGREVITKYSSKIRNKDEFYTDSNGRDMIKRKLNYRETWNVALDEPISGNYYPVTTKISIEDEKAQRRMSVLTDRAQGGSSLREGQIELMVHRRLMKDDGFGVAEALNEFAFNKALVARGQHIVVAAGSLQQNRDELLLQEKEEAIKLSLRPWLFITPVENSFETWSENYNMKGEEIIGELPKNVRILTLEPWKDDCVLLRLEHIFEIDESPKYSVTAQVTIDDLFPNLNVLSVIETTLGANQHEEENERLEWKSVKNATLAVDDGTLSNYSDEKVIVNLKPMEIRTFLVKLSPGNKN